jgi:hypothetical protein
MPTQRLIRMLIEAQRAERSPKAKAPRKPAPPGARSGKRAAWALPHTSRLGIV